MEMHGNFLGRSVLEEAQTVSKLLRQQCCEM